MCAICPDNERCNSYCPIHKAVICEKHCLVCEHHRRPDDPSNVRCRYWFGKEKTNEPDANQLRTMAEHKRKFAEKLYKQGKTRVAEEIEKEIRKINKKIREMEIENESER